MVMPGCIDGGGTSRPREANEYHVDVDCGNLCEKINLCCRLRQIDSSYHNKVRCKKIDLEKEIRKWEAK